jgi:hypothetical protein
MCSFENRRISLRIVIDSQSIECVVAKLVIDSRAIECTSFLMELTLTETLVV